MFLSHIILVLTTFECSNSLVRTFLYMVTEYSISPLTLDKPPGPLHTVKRWNGQKQRDRNQGPKPAGRRFSTDDKPSQSRRTASEVNNQNGTNTPTAQLSRQTQLPQHSDSHQKTLLDTRKDDQAQTIRRCHPRKQTRPNLQSVPPSRYSPSLSTAGSGPESTLADLSQ